MDIKRFSEKGENKVQESAKSRDFIRNSEKLELNHKRDILKGGMDRYQASSSHPFWTPEGEGRDYENEKKSSLSYMTTDEEVAYRNSQHKKPIDKTDKEIYAFIKYTFIKDLNDQNKYYPAEIEEKLKEFEEKLISDNQAIEERYPERRDRINQFADYAKLMNKRKVGKQIPEDWYFYMSMHRMTQEEFENIICPV